MAKRKRVKRAVQKPIARVPEPAVYQLALATPEGELLRTWDVAVTDSHTDIAEVLNLATATHSYVLLHEVREAIRKATR